MLKGYSLFCILQVKETARVFTTNLSARKVCFKFHGRKLHFAIGMNNAWITAVFRYILAILVGVEKKGIVCISPIGNNLRMTSNSPQTFKNVLHFNRPFPSSLVSLFQTESKCKTILVKKTLICTKMKLYEELDHFYMKGFAQDSF